MLTILLRLDKLKNKIDAKYHKKYIQNNERYIFAPISSILKWFKWSHSYATQFIDIHIEMNTIT